MQELLIDNIVSSAHVTSCTFTVIYLVAFIGKFISFNGS